MLDLDFAGELLDFAELELLVEGDGETEEDFDDNEERLVDAVSVIADTVCRPETVAVDDGDSDPALEADVEGLAVVVSVTFGVAVVEKVAPIDRDVETEEDTVLEKLEDTEEDREILALLVEFGDRDAEREMVTDIVKLADSVTECDMVGDAVRAVAMAADAETEAEEVSDAVNALDITVTVHDGDAADTVASGELEAETTIDSDGVTDTELLTEERALILAESDTEGVVEDAGETLGDPEPEGEALALSDIEEVAAADVDEVDVADGSTVTDPEYDADEEADAVLVLVLEGLDATVTWVETVPMADTEDVADDDISAEAEAVTDMERLLEGDDDELASIDSDTDVLGERVVEGDIDGEYDELELKESWEDKDAPREADGETEELTDCCIDRVYGCDMSVPVDDGEAADGVIQADAESE